MVAGSGRGVSWNRSCPGTGSNRGSVLVGTVIALLYTIMAWSLCYYFTHLLNGYHSELLQRDVYLKLYYMYDITMYISVCYTLY